MFSDLTKIRPEVTFVFACSQPSIRLYAQDNVINETVRLSRMNDQEQPTVGSVAIFFTAAWCKPCKAFFPIVEKCFDKKAKRKQLFIADYDANVALAEHFGIRSFPTLLIVRNGYTYDMLAGTCAAEKVLHFIDKL